MSKHSQSKNFKKPPTSWRNAQSQIPQNGGYSTSGPRPPKGSPQFNVPTTPPLKQYGMFVADTDTNSTQLQISGAPDNRWDEKDLANLSKIHASDFEAVDESALQGFT